MHITIIVLIAGAEKVHGFVSEATDTNDRMNEKAKALLSEDYGKDLPGVETLIRRHQELERDLTVIEAKLEVSSHPKLMGSVVC